MGYPVVVKPCSLAASRGVIRADDERDARRVAATVRRIAVGAGRPAGEPLLVESFVPGDEVALEGLLTDGRLEVLAVFDKPDPLDGPFFEETIYVTPSRHPAALQRTLAATVAVGALRGTRAFHAEPRARGYCRKRRGGSGMRCQSARRAGDSAEAGVRAAVKVLEVAARTIGGTVLEGDV